MIKRCIATLFAAALAVGLASAPAQAQPVKPAVSVQVEAPAKVVKAGWDWGGFSTKAGWDWGGF